MEPLRPEQRALMLTKLSEEQLAEYEKLLAARLRPEGISAEQADRLRYLMRRLDIDA